ncbi:MAG: RluA family pseudouridine synthase [Vicinamibacteria bacterium]
MPAEHRLTVGSGADEAGVRLDRFLARQLPALSRARLQALIEEGAVRVDGGSAKASQRLRAGAVVDLTVPEPAPAVPLPEDLPLAVVHDDPRFLVVDKPAGLVVHPGAGASSGTLVNALLFHVHDLSGVGGVLRPGIVHRLDKGTSGLIVIAKDDAAHRALSSQFALREVRKQYVAVVHGVPAPATGTVDRPIGRDPVHRRRMAVDAPRARAARSSYAVRERLDGASLVDVRIHTGRTHQIRVHLASLGHPIAGDDLYGGRRTPSSSRPDARAALDAFPRPALHAAQLAFRHPGTGAPLAFESPLPADLQALLAAIALGPRAR